MCYSRFYERKFSFMSVYTQYYCTLVMYSDDQVMIISCCQSYSFFLHPVSLCLLRVLCAVVNSFVPETFTTEVLLNDRYMSYM